MNLPVNVRLFLPAAAMLAASSALMACAAHSPTPLPDEPLPPAGETGSLDAIEHVRLAERFEVGAADERAALEAGAALEVAYEEGRAAWLAGNQEEALDDFDRGLEAVLRLDSLDQHPALRARTDEVMASVHELVTGPADSVVPEPAPLVPAAFGASAVFASPYTLPMKDDPSVTSMINFYKGRAKDRFEIGLQRYGRYAPTVQRILEEEGVPADLIWLALVESNYNAHAYSRARARGLWQFIPGTGRKYGLRQDFWVDERSDFEKATRSAARYLKDLHGMFGDWHLAIAAYNAGEGKIGRAIRATGAADYWHIRKTKYIRPETKSYVPALLAVMTIVRDPAAHGVRFEASPPLAWETATVDSCTDLGVIAECAGCTPECVKELNPELRRGATPGTGSYAIRLPAGTTAAFAEKYAQLPPEKRLRWHHHVVRSGDTVGKIAEAYGAGVPSIMAANGLRSANRLSVGTTLLIPTGGDVTAPPAAILTADVADGESSPQRTVRHSYRVRPGDTLGRIARRHGTSVAALAEANGLRNTHAIRVGQRLTIYGAARATSSSGGSSRRVHVVRSGDTLSAIARANGTTVTRLRELNGLSARSVIRPGQRITIRRGTASSPSSPAVAAATAAGTRTHTVKAGDTLTKIASLYKTTVHDLRTWNNLSHRGLIHPGDRLRILQN